MNAAAKIAGALLGARGSAAVAADPALALSPDATPREAAAWAQIVATLVALGLAKPCGCRTFYTAREWQARGESFGEGAILVVVHDGGNVGDAFSYDRENYEAIEAMNAALAPLGLFAESLTTWSTGIYHV